MSQVQTQAESEPRRTTFQRGNGSTEAAADDESPAAISGLFSRAKDLAVSFPVKLRTNIQERPIATLGAFTAVGVGVGVVFGSRLLRSVLFTALGQTAIELGREYIRKQSAGRA